MSASHWLKERLRAYARRAGVGRLVLRARQVHHLGVTKTLRLRAARRTFPPRIMDAPPIIAAAGREVHMLLDRKRLYEGMWAFYSLAYFAEESFRLIVHDDGSLHSEDRAKLLRIFPGAWVVERSAADDRVLHHLRSFGLPRCTWLRESLPFAMKLFDIGFFAEEDHVIVIDSDVLFFKRPSELLAASNDAPVRPRYSRDVAERYCVPAEFMRLALGRECIPAFNPGVMCVPTNTLNLSRVEGYLSHPGFATKAGQPGYYAELTVWAMELTHGGATALPETYALAPSDHEGVVCGHYCGGVGSAYTYYTAALPAVIAAVDLGTRADTRVGKLEILRA